MTVICAERRRTTRKLLLPAKCAQNPACPRVHNQRERGVLSSGWYSQHATRDMAAVCMLLQCLRKQ